ncbi:hypothetical protein ABZ636_31315 [Streptomyces sp. NPDC007251]|uniref:hypothetical protein n=1 Tax=unclassified Streptomyces TaxID=2593676 RepID=UPI0033C03487
MVDWATGDMPVMIILTRQAFGALKAEEEEHGRRDPQSEGAAHRVHAGAIAPWI